MTGRLGRRGWGSFLFKAAAAAGLAAYAEWAFFGHDLGSTVGVFALVWWVAVLAGRPELRRDRRTWPFLALAGGFGLVLVEAPGLLASALFWTSLAIAVLLPRAGRFGHAGHWALRLIAHVIGSLPAPAFDLFHVRRASYWLGGPSIVGRLPLLILPVVGGAIFLGLFALANPIIADAFQHIALPEVGWDLGLRCAFAAAAFTAAWSLLRPRKGPRVSLARPAREPLLEWGGAGASILLSLVVFNAIFLLQNGLDVAFLWSGAKLPEGMTLADYAHRGAYPLIATALLAGLFVLVALMPGGRTAAHPVVRALVVLWVAQNVFLVASSILRTADYIEAYSLTRLRIAALLWMGLVALGLVLIVWRLLRNKTGAWLINANAAAALVVLSAASVVDLGAVAAAWNVTHAREVGGAGVALDLDYLLRLGPSALVPLSELEQRPLPRDLRENVGSARCWIMDRVAREQSGLRGWTWRGARRLARARALGEATPGAGDCPLPAPGPVVAPVPAPLDVPEPPSDALPARLTEPAAIAPVETPPLTSSTRD